MTIKFLDKLIKPFGKYGYLIVGSFMSIPAAYFIFTAVYLNNFLSGLVAFAVMFVIGYCWNKDSERVINEKD